MASSNGWLKAQRKGELVDLANELGLREIDGLRKADLEVEIDEFLSANPEQYQNDAKYAPYFASRARITGSPVKKEAPELKVSKRRATKVQEEVAEAEEDEEPERAVSTSLARTPGRALQLASRIPLPATPAEITQAVDRGTLAVRERVSSLYQESGITEVTQATREALSTVTSVLASVSLLELYFLRPEVLADRYAFTIPAISFLGTPDYPVMVPDLFLLLTTSFWSPALTWAFTSFILPALFGYFFNLRAAAPHSGRGRPAKAAQDYAVDPLTFSVVKAVITYIVYAQGFTFWGWLDPTSIARIDSALYSGWKGVLTGTAVTGLAAMYEAVLRK